MNTSNNAGGRIAALGNQLIEVHIALRSELLRLREHLDLRSPDLRTHCLAFCSAVSSHHTDEDDGTFPALARQFPELRPVLAELQHDHHQVAEMLRRLDALLSSDAEPADLRTEIDGLAALLESHFVYEEKRIVAALNSLPI